MDESSTHYVFYDEKYDAWRCVFEGKVMDVLHETKDAACQNLKQLSVLNGQMYDDGRKVVTG